MTNFGHPVKNYSGDGLFLDKMLYILSNLYMYVLSIPYMHILSNLYMHVLSNL